MIFNNNIFAESVEHYINIGKEYLFTGQAGEAIKYLGKAVEINQNSTEAHLLLGLACKETKSYDKALVEFEKMFSLDSSFLKQYYMGKGDIYLSKGLFDKAIEEYEKLILYSPNSVTYSILGNIYYREKKLLDKAKDYLLEAIKMDKNNYDAHFDLASIYFEQESYDKAIEEYKIAINLNPNAPEAYRGLGGACGDSGKYPEAVENFEKAISFAPDNSEYHRALGLAYVSIDRWEDAVNEYKFLKDKYSKEAKELKRAIILVRYFGKTKAQRGIEVALDLEDDNKLSKDVLEHLAIDPEESIEAVREKARVVKNSVLFDMTEECHRCNGSGVQTIKTKEYYATCHSCDKSMNFSFWGPEGRPLGVKTVKCNRCENGEFTLRSGRKVECNRCGGTARVKIKCPTCKGRSFIVVPGETISHPCDKCGGDGRVKVEVFNPVIAEGGVLV